MQNTVFLVLACLWNSDLVQTLDCLRPADSLGRQIPFSCCGGNTPPYLPSGIIAIITSYKFDCCGQVASWKTYVQPDGTEHMDGQYIIDLQVWRPSAMVDANGCYSLVGYDRYSGILGHKGLVSKVSKPSQRITFHAGDVIGLFIFRRYNSSVLSPPKGGIKLDTSYSEETVWYHINSQLNPLKVGKESCPLSVGPGRMLRNSINAAPFLSLQTATFPCSVYQELGATLSLVNPVLSSPSTIQKRSYSDLIKSYVSYDEWTLRSIVGVTSVLLMMVLFALLLFMAVTAVRKKTGSKNIFPYLLPKSLYPGNNPGNEPPRHSKHKSHRHSTAPELSPIPQHSDPRHSVAPKHSPIPQHSDPRHSVAPNYSPIPQHSDPRHSKHSLTPHSDPRYSIAPKHSSIPHSDPRHSYSPIPQHSDPRHSVAPPHPSVPHRMS